MLSHKLLIVIKFTESGAQGLPTIDLYSATDITPQIAGHKTNYDSKNAPSIGIISDGTTGMRLQALALGEAIKESRHPSTSLEDIVSTPPALLRHLPRLARCLPLSWLRVMVGPKLATLSKTNLP